MDSTTSKWQVPDRSRLRTVHPDRLANLENSNSEQATSTSVPLCATASMPFMEEGYRRSL